MKLEETLRTLVEIPSVTGDYKTNNAVEYIDRILSEYGLHVKRFEFNGFESLVATTQRTKKPKLLLAAHIDVVPAPETQFVLREENGRYYGRGVADMKFAIAAYLQLIDDLNGSLHEYDLGLMITSDEEVGGFDGVKTLIDEGYTGGIVILPDTGDTPSSWKFERSAKGRLALKVMAIGKASHGARPWKGENAIDKLTAALQDIQTDFKHQGPDANTLSVCTFRGGEAHNQIPARAEAELDVRTISDADGESMRRRIKKICKQHSVILEEDARAYCPALRADLNNPDVRKFIALAEQVSNKKIDMVDSTAASDARYFEASNIPCIVAGPPCDGYHADNEWVSKEGLEQFRQTLKLYAEEVAKVPAAQRQYTLRP